MSSIEIIDNFLPDEIFYNFAEILMRNSIYQPLDYTGLVSEADGSIRTFGEELVPKNNKSFAEVMFQAVIYSTQVTSATVHDIYNGCPLFFKTIEEHLNVKRWILMRVNCTIGQEFPHTGVYHVDFDEKTQRNHYDTTTAILYLNTNNGGTKFKESGEFVQSKKNRLVKFPTPVSHAGVWATDAKLRYVLNMTYETK